MMSIRHTGTGGPPPADARRATSSGAGQEDTLLDAARDSILAVGWRRSTLTDVARRAGVSRMTIYRRWPDMASLLADLLVREWDAVLATTPIGGAAPVTPSALATSVAGVVGALRVDPLFARIVEVDPELLLPYLLQRRDRNQDRVLALLAAAVGRGQESGAVRSGDPVLLARSLLLAAQGFLLSAPTMTDRAVSTESLDAELRHLIERHLTP